MDSAARYHRHRFPIEIVSRCVWLYFRYSCRGRPIVRARDLNAASRNFIRANVTETRGRQRFATEGLVFAKLNAINLEQPVHLRFETDTRYYMMRLEPDLFGDWTLLKAWGGKTNRLGQQRMDHCANYGDGITRMDEVKKMRLMRKYSQR